jgi:hypothetical protein
MLVCGVDGGEMAGAADTGVDIMGVSTIGCALPTVEEQGRSPDISMGGSGPWSAGILVERSHSLQNFVSGFEGEAVRHMTEHEGAEVMGNIS